MMLYHGTKRAVADLVLGRGVPFQDFDERVAKTSGSVRFSTRFRVFLVSSLELCANMLFSLLVFRVCLFRTIRVLSLRRCSVIFA